MPPVPTCVPPELSRRLGLSCLLPLKGRSIRHRCTGARERVCVCSCTVHLNSFSARRDLGIMDPYIMSTKNGFAQKPPEFKLDMMPKRP